MEDCKKRTLADVLADVSASWMAAIRKGGAERLIGEKLLNYVGMLMIVLGGAFFLKYTHGLAGPMGKLAIGLSCGLALVALGEFLNRQADRAAFSLPLIGGGWILVYYTVFAAGYLPASRVVGSSRLEMVLLAATAAGMILHSLKTRSRLLTVFAFGAAYFVFAITHLGVQTLMVCSILALAGACLVRPLDSPEVAAVNLAGFYLNYFPVFKGFLSAGGGAAFPSADFWFSVAAAAAVHSAYALLTPARKPGQPETWVDAALSFSAVLYAATFYSQVRQFEPMQAAAGLLALSAMLTGLAIARNGKSEPGALEHVQAFLGAVMLALGVLDLPSLPERAWGLALAPSVLGTLGLWLDRRSFERYGLVFLGLALSHGLCHLPLTPVLRPAMALSLAYLGTSAYAFALLRSGAGSRDAGLTRLWAYGGLAALLLGAWTFLSSAAFVTAVFSLAMLLEWGAAESGQKELLHQALLLELAGGLFCFFIDYGANQPVLAVLTPSRLVTASAAFALATAIFGRELHEGEFMGLSYQRWRRLQTWLLGAVAAWGMAWEPDPRQRLAFWGLASLLMLAAGRSRSAPARPVAVHFRAQAYLLALTAAAEGLVSYLWLPAPDLQSLDLAAKLAYWGTSLALLAPLAWRPWAQTDQERSEELGGQHLFALLSLALPALYIAKEADGTQMTLCWTLLAGSYLFGGLLFRRRALRLPGLGLAGLCVGKALFVDLTGLELPYRVLSYTMLGVLLVTSSYLYVQLTGKEDSDEI